MAELNPKEIVRPISFLVDSKGSPKAFFEASTISVSSVFANNFSGLYLSSLTDLELTLPISNGQVLKYYSPSQKWINSTDLNGGGGGGTPFGSIGYIQFNDGIGGFSGLSNFIFSDQTLYVSTVSAVSYLNLPLASYALTSTLVNYETTAYARANYATTANLAISSLNDVADSTPALGDSLVWDGSYWIASSVDGATLVNYATTASLNNYETTAYARANYATTALYATKASLNNYETTAYARANYATTALYATKTSLNNYETTAYARANYATTASLANYATTALYATTASLNNYATTANLAISGLNDVDDTLPTSGYSLVWNGSYWTPSAIGAGVTALSSLTDTQITSPGAGRVLAWNGSKWVASSIAISADAGLAHYGSFSNSSVLSATAANTITYVTYSYTEEANGVSLAGLTPSNQYSSLQFEHAGTYNIQFSLQVSNTDNSEHYINIWPRINNIDVPRSSTKVTVPKTGGGAIGTVIPAWNFILTVGQGDTFQLVFTVDDTRVKLASIPSQSSPYIEPAIPSVIITAQQVMYLQSAADSSATFLTLGANAGLSQERIFTVDGGLGYLDGGAGNNFTISANYTSAIWQPSATFGTSNQTITALGSLKITQNLSAATVSSTSVTSFSSTANTFIETPTTFFVSQGDAQNRRFVMRNETVLDGTPTSLYIDGSSVLAKIPTNTTWHVNARVVCRTDAANAKYAAFERKCLINRNFLVNTTEIVGPVQVIGSDIGSDTGSPPVGWDVNLLADSVNGALDIQVTGTDSDTIRWVAEINLVEVAFN